MGQSKSLPFQTPPITCSTKSSRCLATDPVRKLWLQILVGTEFSAAELDETHTSICISANCIALTSKP